MKSNRWFTITVYMMLAAMLISIMLMLVEPFLYD